MPLNVDGNDCIFKALTPTTLHITGQKRNKRTVARKTLTGNVSTGALWIRDVYREYRKETELKY